MFRSLMSVSGGIDLSEYFVTEFNDANDIQQMFQKAIKKMPNITIGENITTLSYLPSATMINLKKHPKLYVGTM